MAPASPAVRLASAALLLTGFSGALAFGGAERAAPVSARVVQLALRQAQTTVNVQAGDTLRVHLLEDTVDTPLSWSVWQALAASPPSPLILLNTQRVALGERGPDMLRFDVTYTFKVGAAGTTVRLLFVQDAAALNEETRRLFPPVLRLLTVKVGR
ncbi:hypothetical protein GO986_13075 [Deinococcus sp. HMF7620]|uniref:Proteinase inhibitor I42 chagasin domain-containing protein n=1 Tax=Deinococcus arboris TaxID=2682977 RepID=A0A7C9HSK2_9DEIO|nr:hypothetical protein [Deinococcus arboris]MVN87693.1 hypothetical protein [Deinococcus arboris]